MVARQFPTTLLIIQPLGCPSLPPQAFARLSAVYGGVYMLNRPDVQVTFDASGQATGVTSGGQAAKARFVVGDPSYFPSKARLVAKVVRAIAFLVSDGCCCVGSGCLG